MYNYTCFKIKSKIKGDPSPKDIFSMWLLQVKSACHKWRVSQKIRRALPSTCHINLGLDYTKLWYADDHWSTCHTTHLSSKYLRNYLDNLG